MQPTSASSTGTDDTTSSGSSTGDPLADECSYDEDCPAGHVCCGGFFEPYVCEALAPGQCGGTVECEPGYECSPGGIECPIGECIPQPGSTGDGSGTASTG